MRYSRLLQTSLAAFALGGSVSAVSAQNAFYTTGTYTIDAAHSVSGFAFVGLDSSFSPTDSMGHPYTPTVNVVNGGSVGFGAFGGGITTFNSSQVNVTGGSIASFNPANNGRVNISGGAISGFTAQDSSQVVISGGIFGKFNGVNFFDQTTGSFTLVGNNLLAINLGADPFNGSTDYALTGMLLGGTNLAGYVLNVQTGSSFTLQSANAVPEPSSLALWIGVGIAVSTVLRRPVARRRSKGISNNL